MARKSSKKAGKKTAKKAVKQAAKKAVGKIKAQKRDRHPAETMTVTEAMKALGALTTAKTFIRAAYHALFGEAAPAAKAKGGGASKPRPANRIGRMLKANHSVTNDEILADEKIQAYGYSKAKMTAEIAKVRAKK